MMMIAVIFKGQERGRKRRIKKQVKPFFAVVVIMTNFDHEGLRASIFRGLVVKWTRFIIDIFRAAKKLSGNF